LNHKHLWERCKTIFRDNLTQEQYEAWIAPVTSLSFENNCLTVAVPSAYYREHWEHNINLIASTLRRVYGENVQLYYNYKIVNSEPSSAVSVRSDNPSPAATPRTGVMTNPFQPQVQDEIDSQLNPRYTFENYCGSLSNKIARSIGEAIASNPNCKTFNPLFIFGPSGVGKTHLIHAIGIRIKERNPMARVLYVTARLFESQFTAASCKGKVNEFIHFYQSIDVLIIDDIQDLMNKPATQNTFFHIFNHLQLNQKQLILTSDVAPANMEKMEERLLNRFKWGMTAELERPDYELRKDVLNQKAEQDGLTIPPEVMEFIARNVTDSIRELEGIVVSLMAHATVLGRDISLDLAEQVLAHAVKINRRQINFEMIAEQVSSFYNISVDQLFTKSRKREISDARQLIMYLAKKHSGMPLTTIGAKLSRTHATVLHACKNIESRLSIESKLQADVTAIENELHA
ncbi:MAG: chromosomal replication initiator protein DnaA, partial [Muribaculaceae bacterium]|nr:chromosomal replication initiator protein DnaA [Muribaculaceae bacterium]